MVLERTRKSLALAAALGVHLVATLVVRLFALPALASSPVSPVPDSIVELSPSDEPAPLPDPRAPSLGLGVAADETVAGRVREVAAAVAASRETPGDTALAGSREASGPPRDARSTVAAPLSSGWTFQIGTPDIHPRGVDFVAPDGSHALAAAPPPASTSGGLIEALDAADVERGLGRGGPVNSAVAAAARQDGPVRGNATFSVTIFSDGHVDVQVASAQTDWSRLIPAIREAVRLSKVRLPPRSGGLKVVVAVDASVRYPDGYAPPESTEVDVTATVGPGQPSDSVAAGAPRATMSVRGKRCHGAITLTVGGVGGGVDCSLAGVAARQVATRIVSENRL